jgi:hypothetical protein
MKRLFITTAALALAVSGAFAQGISGGLRAGMNVANSKFEASGVTVTPDSKAGFLAGAYLTAMFTENMGIQPEAYFSVQGFKMDDAKQSMNYVNVPVLFRYNINSFLNVHAGPQVGILLKAEQDDGSGNTVDVKDQAKATDFSAVAGAGVDLPFGLNGGIRYCLGLSNVDDTDSGFTVKNRSFQIYVGYRLFGKK